MQLHGVVPVTVITERSAEEARCDILKARDGTLLALAALLVVAITATSSNYVFAQYAPCPPGYTYVGGGGCYPGYYNPYNSYNNCQTGYFYPGYQCYYAGYSPYNTPYYNPYSNCQNGYYFANGYYGRIGCYYPSNYYYWHHFYRGRR